MKKIKSFFQKHVKSVMAVVSAVALSLVSCVSVFAEDAGSTVVKSSDVMPVINEVMKQFNVGSIISILVSAISVSIGFVFLWWAVRKIHRTFFSGAKGGRSSV